MPLMQPMVAAFGLVCPFMRPGRGKVKLLLFGATGTVGHGILRECLLDHNVAPSRRPSARNTWKSVAAGSLASCRIISAT